MTSFQYLANRIIDRYLSGYEPIYTEESSIDHPLGVSVSLPLITGELHDLYDHFGYDINKVSCVSNGYISELILYLDQNNRVPELLAYLFSFKRFRGILGMLTDPQEIRKAHNQMIEWTIAKINASLIYDNLHLVLEDNVFSIYEIGDNPIPIEVIEIKKVTKSYIQGFPSRIAADIQKQNFDSVVSHSRTLLEDVFMYIINDYTHKTNKSSGDLLKIWKECKVILNLTVQSDWDKDMKEFASGLEKIIQSISRMRNSNSDAHGTGDNRHPIEESEARFIANLSTCYCEYVLRRYEEIKRTRKKTFKFWPF